MIRREQKILFAVLLPLLLVLTIFWYWGADERAARRAQTEEETRVEKIAQIRAVIQKYLGPLISHNQFVPATEMEWQGKKRQVKVDYTIDADLQNEAEKLLKSYRPDYGAIVVMDAITGAVKAMASFEKGNHSNENLALRGTYPAASVFKIVTATAALDKYKLSPDTLVMFNGSNHTLYRKNVMYTKVNRWTREMTLRQAFARSINTAFGRLTFERLQPKDIEEYAIRFGFNKAIQTDLPFDAGFTYVPNEKNYQLAEIASGFNRITTMSPLQGAMIASSVAATGVMRVPYIVDAIKDENDRVLFKSEPVTAAVTMSGEGAERLKDLMQATIKRGTSQKSFRSLVHDRKFKELEIGGKTGSLQGMNPRGKVDWFVGYAIGGESERLAIGAITVNKEFWTVKSAYLAQAVFKKHFKEQFSEQNRKFFNAANQHED
jgi:penicillin-binding protein A